MTPEQFVDKECVMKTHIPNRFVVYREKFYNYVAGERGPAGYPTTELIAGGGTLEEAKAKAARLVRHEMTLHPEKVISDVRDIIKLA